MCTSAHADFQEALNEYQNSVKTILVQLNYLQRNAGPCGIIGTQMARKMPESISGLKENSAIVSAVTPGVASKGTIKGLINEVKAGNQEMETNLDMVRFGLSGESCKGPAAAFEKMRANSLLLPDKLRKIYDGL